MARLILIMLCGFNTALAQKPSVNFVVNGALSINFPRVPQTSLVDGFSVTSANSATIDYHVSVNDKSYYAPMNNKQFDSAMERLAGMYLALGRYRSYKRSITDTFLGGMRGKFLRATDPSEPVDIKAMFMFITLQESKSYFVQCNVIEEAATNDEDIASFYSTMKFVSSPYVIYEEPTPKWVWYLIYGGLLLLALIIFFVLRSKRRARRRALLGDAFR
ncbi:MAG TPA: hypothetical protein VD993_18610 [Chitinophagaceae bacterium]|nr:hypothetical protein [Chitinophagaceae bacterium]